MGLEPESDGDRNLRFTKPLAVVSFRVVSTFHQLVTGESASFFTSCPWGITAMMLFAVGSGSVRRFNPRGASSFTMNRSGMVVPFSAVQVVTQRIVYISTLNVKNGRNVL